MNAPADAPSPGRITRFVRLVRPVRSLPRALSFYCGALGFVPDDREPVPPAHALLRLGTQTLELVEAGAHDTAAVIDLGSEDPRFQHIALVTSDMAAAMARLQHAAPGLETISRGGPQALDGPAAGITAFKFRDPDGHPLELLSFTDAALPARWRSVRSASSPVIGLDHSALSVGDTEASVRFYREVLGLSLSGRQVNHGPAQARLDGLDDATVEVVSLSPAQPTPHLELLGYHRPGRRQGAFHFARSALADLTVLQVDTLAALLQRWPSAWPTGAGGPPSALHVSDPDGHRLLLTEARGPSGA